MDLSIIIVSFNTKNLLDQCLKSIFQSELKTNDYEILIIDNASSDESDDLIKEYKSKKTNIKAIFNEQNIGFAKAVNQGIKESKGKCVLLLNSDTRVEKTALHSLLEFESEVSPAIIGAKLIFSSGEVQPSVFNFPTLKRAINEYWLGKKNSFSSFAPGVSSPTKVEAVVGGAMLISRSVIEKVGLFDERYFMYFEDLDYCKRARKAGFKVYYLPTAEIIHEHGASGKTLVEEKNQWRRLLPSSKTYHGLLKHFLINFVLWSGQKLKKSKKAIVLKSF